MTIKPIYVLLFLIFGLNTQQSFAQKQKYSQNVGNLKRDTISFGKDFAKLADSDSTFNYYAVNMNEFDSKFLKVYFKVVAGQEPKLIAIDFSPFKNTTWFKAYNSEPTKDILDLLGSVMQRTISTAETKSKEYKRELVEKY